jgi:hypothetical protein
LNAADPAGKGGGETKKHREVRCYVPSFFPSFLRDMAHVLHWQKSNKTLSHYQFNLLTVPNRKKKHRIVRSNSSSTAAVAEKKKRKKKVK